LLLSCAPILGGHALPSIVTDFFRKPPQVCQQSTDRPTEQSDDGRQVPGPAERLHSPVAGEDPSRRSPEGRPSTRRRHVPCASRPLRLRPRLPLQKLLRAHPGIRPAHAPTPESRSPTRGKLPDREAQPRGTQGGAPRDSGHAAHGQIRLRLLP
jgi:hypothetical protein